MNLETFVGGTMLTGALIGLVAAFWSKIKALTWKLASLFVVRITLEGSAATAVAGYLWRKGHRSRYGERAYNGHLLFVRPADRRLAVAFEHISNDSTVFWLNGLPMLVVVALVTSGSTYLGTKLTITFLRGTFSSDAIIEAAMDDHNDRRHGGEVKRFSVHRAVGKSAGRRRRGGGMDDDMGKPVMSGSSTPTGMEVSDDISGRRYIRWKDEDIGAPAPDDPLGPLAFPGEVEELYEEARRWLASEKWYKGRRIPWRRGWMFYGPPGTGKTSLAKAVAQELDLPIVAMELATLDDSELISWWHFAMGQAPVMILLEDLDAVFKKRENRLGDQGAGLNFGCLLNCISGVEGSDGVLLIITTNVIEDIDPAIGVPMNDGSGQSTRPGRVDRAVELGPLTEDCRLRLATRILSECPDEIERAVTAGKGNTGAQFQDLCCRVALKRHWQSMAELDNSLKQERESGAP